MRELSDDEKKALGEIAWVICRKGHLTIPAIIRFANNVSKKDIKLFYNLGFLKKHRTDTYELTPFGKALGIQHNLKFKKIKRD
ncbi:hypothetical protein J4442_04590 [Candidatus Woesearchaeota archaeon]|nr:hypothetical protein [Candidatus Woesearchaeota archaeon]